MVFLYIQSSGIGLMYQLSQNQILISFLRSSFSRELQHGINRIKPALRLTSDYILVSIFTHQSNDQARFLKIPILQVKIFKNDQAYLCN